MTSVINSHLGASSASTQLWDATNWHLVRCDVKRLQMRIAKAVRDKRYGKVKALQWLLTHSFSAKLLAVKRVTDNAGAKTPGVDGVVWKTTRQKIQAVRSLRRRGYKAKPLRRIYIAKTSGESRPLSIPVMKCRAMQALYRLGLEPVAEMWADKNAYGFRPKRSTADALRQCHTILSRKTSACWILEGDIRACFDTLSSDWLQRHIPMDKIMLYQWLKAGYREDEILYPTTQGVPQGGIISPTLLVMALSGLEEAVKSKTRASDKVHVVSYADDFIVTGASKEILVEKVLPIITSFLAERGLELSPHKTRLTHIDTGFDFLGFQVRKYAGKLLIKPFKKNIKSFLGEIRQGIKSRPAYKTQDLIRYLNPKIRGWAGYYRHCVAKRIFGYVDHCIFKTLIGWINRRHCNKNNLWKYHRYFRSQGLKKWIFTSGLKDVQKNRGHLDLFRASQISIRRHIKIKGDATPYDPAYCDYFQSRQHRQDLVRVQEQKVSLKLDFAI